MGAGRHLRRGADQRDRGAALVEFAILMPLLVLLLLGIVEFGWGTAQQIDLRHKAREALRVAVVDGTDAEVIARVCNDDIVAAGDITTFVRGGGSTVGDAATVTLEANVQEITGFFGWAWGAAGTITSSVEGRNEQPVTEWTVGENLSC